MQSAALAVRADESVEGFWTVSAGKFADIIAVKGDVLEHIDLLSRVDLVMKHGKRVMK